MKNMHQQYSRHSKKLVVKYYILIGFDFFFFFFVNSGLSSYGRSLLAAEIDVSLSQENTLRLNSGTRG